jgi:hypothetical protein
MKNLHLITTYKASRLFYDISMDKLILGSYSGHSTWFENKHIYITSEKGGGSHGEYYIYTGSSDGIPMLCQFDKIYNPSAMAASYNKKIILTTDEDLIKDGVQAIDDDFLQWFITNSSCEEVEIKSLLSDNGVVLFSYQIINPQEKLEYLEEKENNKKALINTMYEVHSKRKELKPIIKIGSFEYYQLEEFNKQLNNRHLNTLNLKYLDKLRFEVDSLINDLKNIK